MSNDETVPEHLARGSYARRALAAADLSQFAPSQRVGVRELSHLFNVTMGSIHRWRWAGGLPESPTNPRGRKGTLTRWTLADVLRFLANRGGVEYDETEHWHAWGKVHDNLYFGPEEKGDREFYASVVSKRVYGGSFKNGLVFDRQYAYVSNSSVDVNNTPRPAA